MCTILPPLQLIRVNQPDLVLFVGEALVGNEAVDQLVKFNRALVDHAHSEQPRTIDGIVLTKFDTIDDKVQEVRTLTPSPLPPSPPLPNRLGLPSA